MCTHAAPRVSARPLPTHTPFVSSVSSLPAITLRNIPHRNHPPCHPTPQSARQSLLLDLARLELQLHEQTDKGQGQTDRGQTDRGQTGGVQTAATTETDIGTDIGADIGADMGADIGTGISAAVQLMEREGQALQAQAQAHAAAAELAAELGAVLGKELGAARALAAARGEELLLVRCAPRHCPGPARPARRAAPRRTPSCYAAPRVAPEHVSLDT